MGYTTSPAPRPSDVEARALHTGDVVVGIPALSRGQRAVIVSATPLVQAFGYEPKVQLTVTLPGQGGEWDFRVAADLVLTVVESGADRRLAEALGGILAEMSA